MFTHLYTHEKQDIIKTSPMVFFYYQDISDGIFLGQKSTFHTRHPEQVLFWPGGQGVGALESWQRLFTHISDTGRATTATTAMSSGSSVKPKTLRNRRQDEDDDPLPFFCPPLRSNVKSKRNINILVLSNRIARSQFRRRCNFLSQQPYATPPGQSYLACTEIKKEIASVLTRKDQRNTMYTWNFSRW